MEISLATKNKGKIREFSEIFGSAVPLLDYPEVPETGSSFIENASLKAKTIGALMNRAVLSDDSGLLVYALDLRPGIYSARYGGESLSDKDRCRLILSEMKDKQDRRARFTAALALYLPSGEIIVAEGHLEGSIIFEMRGENGFGYDSIFCPVGYTETLAELSAEVKNQLSHRKAAAVNLLSKIEHML